MKKTISNGWHEIGTCSVYTENGIITRATKQDRNGSEVPAAIYRKSQAEYNGWDNVMPCKYDTFRAGWRKGTYDIF